MKKSKKKHRVYDFSGLRFWLGYEFRKPPRNEESPNTPLHILNELRNAERYVNIEPFEFDNTDPKGCEVRIKGFERIKTKPYYQKKRRHK